MTCRHIAQQQAGGQHMFIPGEIADRQQIDARLFLLLPVSRTQLAARLQQGLLRAVARPVTLQCFFQFTAQANSGKAEGMVEDSHVLFSR